MSATPKPAGVKKQRAGKCPRRPSGPADRITVLEYDLACQRSELDAVMDELALCHRQQEEANTRYQSIYDLAPVGYVNLGPDGSISAMNFRAAAMSGYERGHLIGKQFSMLVAGDSRDEFYRFLKGVYTGRTLTAFLSIKPRKGPLLPLQVSGAKVSDGRDSECIIAFTDISEQKRLQTDLAERMTELSKAKDELESRVRERTSELEASNEDLRKSREELRELGAYQLSVREEERVRIARDIHDELGQTLAALRFGLSWLEEKVAGADPVVARRAKDMNTMVSGLFASVQRILAELRPTLLDTMGLSAAADWLLKEFQRTTGIKAALSMDGSDAEMQPEISTNLYRIMQELLNNVARHSGASKVSVSLKISPEAAVLNVRDNGKGITAGQLQGAGSFGLLGIRERVRHMAGEVAFDGGPKGTTITVSIPTGETTVGGKNDKTAGGG